MPDETREGLAVPDPSETDVELAEMTAQGMLSLEEALASSAQQTAVARAARLEADARVVDILRADNFEGPRYRQAATGWMEYGWRTISKWTASDEIFIRSRLAGRPVPADMTPPPWNAEDRAQVATDTVIGGMAIFYEHGLVRGKWTPNGGASLTTYVVGASIRAFRPVYIRWYRSNQTGQSELDLPTVADDGAPAERDIPDQRATDPYDAAATHDELRRVLPYITDTQVREGLAWRAMGYTQAEAAKRAGLTEKALEGRIRRVRSRILTDLTRQPELGEGGAR